jgi:HEAT repeat protein
LRSPEYEFRWEASAALGKLGKAAVPELINALAEKDFETKEAAIASLGTLGPEAEAAVDALRLALEHPHSVVRTMAAYSLSSIGVRAWPTLMDVAENGSEVARGAARQGLEKSEQALQASAPALIKLAADQNPVHRKCAYKLLSRIRGQETVLAAIVSGLNDPVVRGARLD